MFYDTSPVLFLFHVNTLYVFFPKSIYWRGYSKSPLSLELSKMRMCICMLVHESRVHCHMCASSKSRCVFVHFTMWYDTQTVVQRLYFRPWMSRRKRKATGDAAGAAKCAALYYISKYCPVRLNLFSLFFVFVFMYNLCEKYYNQLQYSTI